MRFKLLLSYILIIGIAVGLASCSDNGSGPDHGEPPSIPDLSVVAQPDISFFEENGPQGKTKAEISATDHSNFSNAALIVTLGTFFTSSGQLYMSFLNPAYNSDAEYNDGQWEWSYNYSAEGQSMSIKFTAKESGSNTNWVMFISYNDGQGGGYDNYKLVEGTTKNDGAEGQWTFNTLSDDNSTEMPAVVTEWLVSSETEKTITTDIYDEGSVSSTMNYEEDSPDHTMTFHDLEDSGSGDQEVYWNSDTDVGYVIESGTKQCWNSSFENAPCSEVGL